MAENKKSVLLYCDIIHTVEKLTDEQAVILFKHYLKYINNLSPESDAFTEIIFESIKQNLKRDLVKWGDIKDERSLNGRIGNLKRWNNDLFVEYSKGNITLEDAKNKAKHRKTSPPDATPSPPIANIAVNDNVNVNVKVKEEKKEYAEFVSMSENEYQKLINKHKKKNTDLFISMLDNYKGSSGKKYKSDYRTI